MKLWSPTADAIQQSQLTLFKTYLQETHDLHFSDYQALWQWSVNEAATFWQAYSQFQKINFHQRPNQVKSVQGQDLYQTKWFEGATLNFAENLLQNTSEKTAITSVKENGDLQKISYAELKQRTAMLANAMRASGIEKNDRIAAVMPNCIETVIAMLATSSIGAIWSSCSPDFGHQGILDRFGQIQPKLLFCVDGYRYNGKSHDCLAKIAQLQTSLPCIKQVIVCPFNESSPQIDALNNSTLFENYLSNDTRLTFEALPFDQPLYIMYSSGTTGTPKCIVHGAGGTLIQHLKELSLHTNLTDKDTFFFFTTCGWMMWNWMISSLALGCHILLYDGCPTVNSADQLFELVDTFRVSVFGCGAKYIDAVESAGLKPSEKYAFESLKAILSTGSPLAHHSFDFIYQHVKKELQLSSISGGTDIISCFALGNPNLPVYRGELQCKGLGMDVSVVNDNGEEVFQQKGELVCKSAFPSMPIYFWNDPENQKYHHAYFERFKGMWAQGDYAEQTENNGLIIYGRSDATLNPGGVRIGTAEIYRQVEKISQVIDSVVIGQPWQEDERIILFVQLKDKTALTETLKQTITQTIRQHTTPRHVPADIIQVNAIPRTISGKVVELAVKKVVCGEKVNNVEAIANPEALEQFKPQNWL